jgi:hypothetical protein
MKYYTDITSGVQSSLLQDRNNIFFKNLTWLAIVGVLSTFPYIIWYLFGKYYILFSTLISVLLFISVFYVYRKEKLPIDNWLIILIFFWVSIFVYSFFNTIQNADFYGIRRFLGVSFKILMIISIVLLFKIKGVYNYCLNIFFKLNILILLLSLILFFLLFSGIEIEPIRFIKIDNRMHNFYWIGATNAVFNFNTTIIRIAGFADEPGAFAMILTYLLIINEFTYKNNFYRIILSIGGIFTFSVAFVITFFPILLYWLIKPIITMKHIAFVALVVGIAVVIVSNKFPDISDAVEKLTINRLERTDDGSIKGDNRSWAIPLQLEAFEKYPLFGTGINPELVQKYELSQPSFFSFLGTWGIYGYLFFYIPYLFLLFQWIHKKEVLLFLAIGLIFFQRPGIEDTFILFCFTLIYYSKSIFTLTMKDKV